MAGSSGEKNGCSSGQDERHSNLKSEKEGNHTGLQGGLVLMNSGQCIPEASTLKPSLRIPKPSLVEVNCMTLTLSHSKGSLCCRNSAPLTKMFSPRLDFQGKWGLHMAACGKSLLNLSLWTGRTGLWAAGSTQLARSFLTGCQLDSPSVQSLEVHFLYGHKQTNHFEGKYLWNSKSICLLHWGLS